VMPDVLLSVFVVGRAAVLSIVLFIQESHSTKLTETPPTAGAPSHQQAETPPTSAGGPPTSAGAPPTSAGALNAGDTTISEMLQGADDAVEKSSSASVESMKEDETASAAAATDAVKMTRSAEKKARKQKVSHCC